MTIPSDEELTRFYGLPVVAVEDGLRAGIEQAAWKIPPAFHEGTEPLLDQFSRLVEQVSVQALVIGNWGGAFEAAPVAEILELADRLPDLRALFLADISPDECEISWIQHGDITPLFAAFPKLEVFRVRGSSGLVMEPIAHAALRELAFETGGLPAGVTRAVAASDLPALEHLELWFGEEEYGCDTTLEDVAPILVGERLPALRHLGLRNCEFADLLAAALAGAPIVPRLTSLDLSLGLLSDEGVGQLLDGQSLTHLTSLDLHWHSVSEEGLERLGGALPDVRIDASESQAGEPEDERYVAVGE
ncbi:STM4015 family protein [Cryptosporangium japonicum]|uniref:STM4015 family protein n=1 Tax=Cryptosporangium japonicum TaxID=80872 RepID=A0ABN0UAG0_9ACTN